MGSNTATFLPEYPQKGLFFSTPLVEALHDPSSVALIDIRAFDCSIFGRRPFESAHRLHPMMAF